MKSELHDNWAGRVFKNMDTLDVFIIPDNVSYGAFYTIGGGFIDVGDGLMYRVGGNIKEINKDKL